MGRAVDQLHAACLAGSVLLIAVVSETTPLEVLAGVDGLIVEAHGGGGAAWMERFVVWKCGAGAIDCGEVSRLSTRFAG